MRPMALEQRYTNLHVSAHPLVAHKLSLLRDKQTDPKQFRELVRELSWLIGYEALADLSTQPSPIETPLEQMDGVRVEPKVGLIPVLRAGLGMVEAVLQLMPSAQVWPIRLHRGEAALEPVRDHTKPP